MPASDIHKASCLVIKGSRWPVERLCEPPHAKRLIHTGVKLFQWKMVYLEKIEGREGVYPIGRCDTRAFSLIKETMTVCEHNDNTSSSVTRLFSSWIRQYNCFGIKGSRLPCPLYMWNGGSPFTRHTDWQVEHEEKSSCVFLCNMGLWINQPS